MIYEEMLFVLNHIQQNNLLNIYTIKKSVQFLINWLFYKKDRALQFWQEGVHPEWVQNEDMLRQKVEYIHNNPVKRGYVDEAEHWRYSSARNYAGLKGLIEVCKAW